MINWLTSGADAPRWLRNLLRFVALALGAAHTGAAILSQSMNEDGINYLDMGAAYFDGHWETAVNAIWSPLYAWIVGAVVGVLEPSIRWEFPVVQLTNLAIYASTLVCFEFFWRELTLRYYRQPEGAVQVERFSPALWLVLGYSLFIYSALNLGQVWAVTPDMCVAALVYLAAGFALRLAQPDARGRDAILLGAVLGFGYLAKAAMFPLAIVAIVLIAILSRRADMPWVKAATTMAAFLIIAGPYLVVLSLDQGKPTFGDVGRFTYLKHVGGMPYPHFRVAPDSYAGTPTHPARQFDADPPVYEFAEPIGGTYPLAYDPGYWTNGLAPSIKIGQQLKALATNGVFYFDLFVRIQGGFVAIVLLLCLLSASSGARLTLWSVESALVLWAVAAFGLYSLVYVIPRYVAPFVMLFWCGLLASIQFPQGAAYRRVTVLGSLLLVLFVWTNIAAFNLQGLSALVGFSPAAEAARASFEGGAGDDHVALAENLRSLGIARGDKVGFIGYSFTAFWARLARVRIVAEITPEDADSFWTADANRQAEILQRFAEAGAVAVVAAPADPRHIPEGWAEIGQTGYLVHLLRRDEPAP